jgi:hypothetical protein
LRTGTRKKSWRLRVRNQKVRNEKVRKERVIRKERVLREKLRKVVRKAEK